MVKPLKRAVLITGAGDRLGAAIALNLASQGYYALIHAYRNGAGARATLDRVRAQGGDGAVFSGDLCDDAALVAMFESIGSLLRVEDTELVGLVQCASVFIPSRLDTLSLEDWDRLMNINVRSAWRCAQECANLMQFQKNSGHHVSLDRSIILFADSGAHQGWSGYGGYVLAKRAILALGELLARVYAPDIRVNTISPGLILNNGLDEPSWHALTEKTLLKQSGTVDDVLSAVDYLMTATHVTGTELIVDGGYRFRDGC